MGRPGDRRDQWRRAVYAPREGMTNGCRVLLLRLADQGYPDDGGGRMNANGVVSIPRKRLAEDLGVAPARITERLNLARELGLLDIVKRARRDVTAVYQAITPANGVRPAVPHSRLDRSAMGYSHPDVIGVRPGVPPDVVDGVRHSPYPRVVKEIGDANALERPHLTLMKRSQI